MWKARKRGHDRFIYALDKFVKEKSCWPKSLGRKK